MSELRLPDFLSWRPNKKQRTGIEVKISLGIGGNITNYISIKKSGSEEAAVTNALAYVAKVRQWVGEDEWMLIEKAMFPERIERNNNNWTGLDVIEE